MIHLIFVAVQPRVVQGFTNLKMMYYTHVQDVDYVA